MALKDEWKETGKGLGSAFKGLGKTVARSIETGVDAADGEKPADSENVFKDGTWRKTGKALGGAFIGLGRSIVHSAEQGLDKLDNAKEAPEATEVKEDNTEDNTEK